MKEAAPDHNGSRSQCIQCIASTCVSIGATAVKVNGNCFGGEALQFREGKPLQGVLALALRKFGPDGIKDPEALQTNIAFDRRACMQLRILTGCCSLFCWYSVGNLYSLNLSKTSPSVS